MKTRRACILGGTGFVGRHLVAKFASEGIETIVPSRHPQRNRDLAVNPGCRVVQADIFNSDDLNRLFSDCDIVVNLVGILNERRKNDFRRVHVELSDKVTTACRKNGVKRLLHMSALNANAGSGSSFYLRSKGEGENRAHTGGKPDIAVTSFRPSVIFGADDSFVNRFAGLMKIPGPMPLACHGSRFAPVFINDVCQAMFNSLDDRATFGQRYELCGPEVYSLKEIVKLIARLSGKRKLIVPLGDGLSKLQASILEKLPGKVFTTDNYLSLQQDSVCSGKAPGLDALGIEAAHFSSVVAVFLQNQSERKRYNALRTVSSK
jgi:uncharacterized protein YbjT (DUF2867 family)